jgi:hypothetical protein
MHKALQCRIQAAGFEFSANKTKALKHFLNKLVQQSIDVNEWMLAIAIAITIASIKSYFSMYSSILLFSFFIYRHQTFIILIDIIKHHTHNLLFFFLQMHFPCIDSEFAMKTHLQKKRTNT